MEVRDDPARLVRGGHESELDRQVARQLAEALLVETAVATIRFARRPVSRAAFCLLCRFRVDDRPSAKP